MELVQAPPQEWEIQHFTILEEDQVPLLMLETQRSITLEEDQGPQSMLGIQHSTTLAVVRALPLELVILLSITSMTKR